MSEYWDRYDKDGNKLDGKLVRGETIPEGSYHLVIHLSIFNTRGQLLCQQRTSDKETFPSMWDVTVGGSALAGETSQQAATRELKEELGLDIDFTGVDPAFRNIDGQIIDDHFVLITDGLPVEAITLQQEEVQKVEWFTEQQIRKMIKKKQFIDWKFLNRLFTARNTLLTFIRKQQKDMDSAQK